MPRKNRKGTVVSVGDDPQLLSLRHAILDGAGFRVLTASDMYTASSHIKESNCGVLLLCYSLSLEIRQALIKEFRTRCPSGRVVAVTNQPQATPPIEADAFLYGVEGAEALIEVVRSETRKSH